jgi:hypothetical protein
MQTELPATGVNPVGRVFFLDTGFRRLFLAGCRSSRRASRVDVDGSPSAGFGSIPGTASKIAFISAKVAFAACLLVLGLSEAQAQTCSMVWEVTSATGGNTCPNTFQQWPHI